MEGQTYLETKKKKKSKTEFVSNGLFIALQGWVPGAGALMWGHMRFGA